MQMNKPFCFCKIKNVPSNILWAAGLCVLIAAVYFTSQYLLAIAVVNGDSMYPTLNSGEFLLVGRVHKAYAQGDIILVSTEGKKTNPSYIVKRVIAVGGETVTVDYKKNEVRVNGKPLSEPYINWEEIDPMLKVSDVDIVEYVIPNGCLFVMGDNRNHSMDSRDNEIGFVATEKVIGKVIMPFN